MPVQPILRVELGEVVYPPRGARRTIKTRWELPANGLLRGVSSTPLLDACRALQKAGVADSRIVGIYRAGRDQPDMTCSVGVGARTTVRESKTSFEKWKPRSLGTWHKKEAKL